MVIIHSPVVLRFKMSMMKIMKHLLLGLMLAFQVGCESESSGQASGVTAASKDPDIILESVQVGTRLAQFYVDLGSDSAVLGFSVENDAGQQRYFPMYGSTYRGIPSVTLEVFASASQEEMWVYSSWQGYELLAYHRMGTDQSMTQYGEITSFDQPTPESFGGGTGRFPEMNTEEVYKVANIKYDRNNAAR